MKLIARLLGQFQALWDDDSQSPITWPSKETETLFKILISAQGQPVSQDRLVEQLYPALALGPAVANLYKRVSELRQSLHTSETLKEPVVKEGAGYAISPNLERSVDIEQFAGLIKAADDNRQAADWERAAASYQSAIGLYRHDFLSDDLEQDWTHEPRNHFQQLLLAALESLADCEARLGNYESAIRACEDALARAPLDERFYRQKMLFLALQERPAEALAVYENCVSLLKSRLSAAPSPETERLFRQIETGQLDAIKERYHAPPSETAVNAPNAISNLIERADALYKLAVEQQGVPKSISQQGNATAQQNAVSARAGGQQQAPPDSAEPLKTASSNSDPSAECQQLLHLGATKMDQGLYDEAIKCFQASIQSADLIGDKQVIADALCHLGAVARAMGDGSEARWLLRQGLSMQQDLGSAKRPVAKALLEFARLELADSQLSRALQLFTIAKSALEQMGYVPTPAEQEVFEQNIAELLDSMTIKAFANAERAGREMSLEDGIALALSD